MSKFNFFVASGIIASLLSTIGCTGAFANLETGVSSGENLPYMYINKNNEKDKKEKEENLENENSGSNIGTIIGGIAGATLLAGGIGFGIYMKTRKDADAPVHPVPDIPKPIIPPAPYVPEMDPVIPPVAPLFYTFNIGKDNSQPYELLDSSYNVLKRFKSRDERDKYLKENGITVTDTVPSYSTLEKLRAEARYK